MNTIKQMVKLNKVYRIGKIKYIVIFGVIGWGLSIAIIIPLIDLIIFKKTIIPSEFLTNLIIYPSLGIPFGYFMWNILETQRYNLLKKSEDNSFNKIEENSKDQGC